MLPPKLFFRYSIRKLVIQARYSPRIQMASHTSTAPIKGQEYKLKNLASLDLKPGEKLEVDVEGIDEAKVLLVNTGGKVTALGAKCTHYGAPLVKGVLTGDSRLTCPWHGACFNASTGDIENAPAIDNLPVFKLSERDGAVYVTGEKDAIKGSRRKPNLRPSSVKQTAGSLIGQENVVVVGGGSGAIGTIEALRECGFGGSITMISSEGYLPIDRTKLSKALIPDEAKIALRDQEWFKSADIATVMDEVTDVDFSAKKVVTKRGSSFPYTKLVLATGGSPKNLPLPGFKDLGNIFLLRTVPHVKAINAAIGDKHKKIVVIGSSFIGMEIANCTSKENEVSVVGMEKAPMERVMGEEVGRIFQKGLENNGVKFYMGAHVDKALPSKSNPSKVGAISLKDGTVLEADLVILGVGVHPQTTFLKENKAVELEKDGSLKTNEHFVVDGHHDVYAVGDIATYPYHGPGGNGGMARIEHWNVAQNSGRAVAAHIVNSKAKSKPFIPIFWSALNSQLRYCGNTAGGYDDIIIKGQPEEAKFAAYYTKEETVVAVASMQMDPIMSQASELMRREKMPTKSELQKNLDILSISVPAEVKL